MIDQSGDDAVRGILISNALTIGIAWWVGDGFLLLLWPYWAQSVVIGYFAQRRIRLLRAFSAAGVKMNDRPLEETPAAKHSSANFFVIHYGMFHLFYFIFLASFTSAARETGFAPIRNGNTGEMMQVAFGRLGAIDLLYIAIASASFAWAHLESHRANVEADLRGRPNIGTLMFLPYGRVIPMHLTIILGTFFSGGTAGLLIFGGLKTAADIVMHKVEHRLLRR